MRIRVVEPVILRAPLGAGRFLSSQSMFPERNSLLVRIETDCGLVGWGEGGQYGPPEPVAACVQAVLAPQILGQDPRRPTRLQELLYARTRDFGQKGAYVEAISAIDIALWDLTGQALNAPLHQLLGGVKSAMSYLDATTLGEFRANASFIRVTSAGIVENHPHAAPAAGA